MLVFFATGMFVSHVTANAGAVFPRLSPQYRAAFQSPLPIPEIKKPSASYTSPKNEVPIDFYEIVSQSFTHKFYPDLPGASNLLGYDGTFPGPTIRVQKGRQTVVRVVNDGQDPMNLHLHGSYSRSAFDGFARDLISSSEYKDYYYPNSVARTLWYHDHTNRKNAMNMYKGLVGMYQVVDAGLDESLGIPSGTKYDIPLIFTSHYFTPNGSLSDESKASTSTYGDTVLVNGQIQPCLLVEPKKYRFRLLNAAVSRVFNLTVQDGAHVVPLSVVGSDGGFLQSPTDSRNLIIAMADRWEVMIDFSPYSGMNLTLSTMNMWSDTAYAGMDDIMRFVVEGTGDVGSAHETAIRSFQLDLKFPKDVKVAAERTVVLQSHMDTVWGLNSFHMDDAMSRVMMRPPLGTVERYTFKSAGMGMTTGGRTGSSDPSLKTAAASSDTSNGGMMGGGGVGGHHNAQMFRRETTEWGRVDAMVSMANVGWTHAMHLHLVDMRIVSRRKDDPSKAEGRDYLEDYEKNAVKDVVLLGSNEVVEVLAKFQPYPGVYMFHCHNAVHEDRGMMGIFNVTKLADLGYKDLETSLEDPLDPRFRAKPYRGTNLLEIITKTLPFFAGLNAYPDAVKLAEIEDRYWSTRTPPSGDLTGPAKTGGGMGGMMGGGMGTAPEKPPTSSPASGMASGVNGTSIMSPGSTPETATAGSGSMSGPGMPGGVAGCDPHKSHHGGCRGR